MSFGTKNITLFRAIALALILLALSTMLMPYLGTDLGSFLGMKTGGLILGFGIFATGVAGEYTSFWSVMLIINAILLILLAAVAIFGLIKDVKLLVLPFSLISFITFFLTVFQKLFIDEDEVRVGRGAWFLLLFGLLAAGVAVLDHIASGKSLNELFDLSVLGIRLPERKPVTRAAAAAAAPVWTCANCGAPQPAAVRFCGRCGAPKPEPPRCPNCGQFYQPGEVFCSNCGTKL